MVKRLRFRLDIRAKLLAGFMLVALFTGVLGLSSVITVNHLNASRDAQYGDIFGGTYLVASWANAARVAESDLSAYVLEPDPVVRERLKADMVSTDTQLAGLVDEMDRVDTDRSDTQTLASLSQSWHAYAGWRSEVIMASIDAGDWGDARAAFEAEGSGRSKDVDRAVLAFLDAKKTTSTALKTSADALSDLETLIASGLAGAAMLLALLIGHFFSREISRAAGQVASAAQGLAVGDLDQRVTVHSDDELGQMADAVRSMIAYQNEMADVARTMATGDLTQDVKPKGALDVLGIAFGQMTTNLRTFVSDLQEQAATLGAQAQLLELASDAIMVCDFVTGKIIFWSHGAEEVYGWTRAEALGEVPNTLLATRFPESRAAVQTDLQRSGRWDGELVHTRQDGMQIVVASRHAVQRDQAGRPFAVLQINTNISERKQAEAERAHLAALVEHERSTLASVLASMTDGVLQISKGRVVFCNSQAAAMLGMDVDTLRSSSVPDVLAHLHPSLRDPAAVSESFGAPLTEKTTFEIVFAGPPQRHLLNQRFAIGETGAMGVLLHDLTAERELARSKEELVSMVSHELASPATSLVIHAGLLATHEYPEHERQDMLATMVQEGQHLTTIIQDFLDMQRLEHGGFQLAARPMELRTLFEHAARVAATDGEHQLTVDVPTSLPLVWADPNRVQQVLTNLLSNARKYSPAGGRIWLSARQTDALVEISVTDEGLGIPVEALPHLFDKFYRVEAADRRLIKGTGLGLAIVKEIVEALGGAIGVESLGAGRGSRFWFTLPLAAAPSASERTDVAPSTAMEVPRSANGLRVLVVDDDSAIQSAVRRVLRPDGHQVTLAGSAEEALGRLRSQPFDVVLTDLGLGHGMDGWELADHIHRDWPRVRVIVASGRIDVDPGEAQVRGVAALLAKPYQPVDLRRLLVDTARLISLADSEGRFQGNAASLAGL